MDTIHNCKSLVHVLVCSSSLAERIQMQFFAVSEEGIYLILKEKNKTFIILARKKIKWFMKETSIFSPISLAERLRGQFWSHHSEPFTAHYLQSKQGKGSGYSCAATYDVG